MPTFLGVVGNGVVAAIVLKVRVGTFLSAGPRGLVR